ncbi:Glycerophosphoryl diester phosphodiesterase membrane domain-containing protein [Prescottella defluvii]
MGDAISYGWRKFSGNALSWVVMMLIAAVIQGLLNWAFASSNNAVTFIGGLISIVVGYLIQAAFVTGALHETDGTKPAIGSFFQIRNMGAVVVACFLVGVLTTVGLILCIIPGLFAIFLTWWTLQFVIDQNQDPIGAIKSSFRAISSNWSPLLLLALALLGINILGAIPFGLGLLVTVPLSIIASTYAYRVTVGGPVAP